MSRGCCIIGSLGDGHVSGLNSGHDLLDDATCNLGLTRSVSTSISSAILPVKTPAHRPGVGLLSPSPASAPVHGKARHLTFCEALITGSPLAS